MYFGAESRGTIRAMSLRMNRILQASLLPLVFAFASLGTVACTADSASTESSEDVASRDPVAPTAPASMLDAIAGSAGNAGSATEMGIPTGGSALAADTHTARLAVNEPGVAPVYYDVVGYDFGVDAQPTASLGGSLSVVKPTLRPFTVSVRPSAKTQPLTARLFGATQGVLSVVLERIDAGGKPVALATFDRAGISRLVSISENDSVETYEINALSMTVTGGAATVTVNAATNHTTCADPCPCGVGDSTKLGPYTQAPAGVAALLAKGNTRVDHVSVALTNGTGSTPPAGGSSVGKASLDAISFDRDLEVSGVCALYYAGNGDGVTDVKLGVAALSAPKASESTTWDACYATVIGVGFSSSVSGPREKVVLDARGVVRVDRAFDFAGKPTGETTTGWSFALNQPVTSCAAVLPASKP
jgi:hypothetical protein